MESGESSWDLVRGAIASNESLRLCLMFPPGTGKVMAEMLLDGTVQSADVLQLDPSHHLKTLGA